MGKYLVPSFCLCPPTFWHVYCAVVGYANKWNDARKVAQLDDATITEIRQMRKGLEYKAMAFLKKGVEV